MFGIKSRRECELCMESMEYDIDKSNFKINQSLENIFKIVLDSGNIELSIKIAREIYKLKSGTNKHSFLTPALEYAEMLISIFENENKCKEKKCTEI